jgi:hypothetical protein
MRGEGLIIRPGSEIDFVGREDPPATSLRRRYGCDVRTWDKKVASLTHEHRDGEPVKEGNPIEDASPEGSSMRLDLKCVSRGYGESPNIHHGNASVPGSTIHQP